MFSRGEEAADYLSAYGGRDDDACPHVFSVKQFIPPGTEREEFRKIELPKGIIKEIKAVQLEWRLLQLKEKTDLLKPKKTVRSVRCKEVDERQARCARKRQWRKRHSGG